MHETSETTIINKVTNYNYHYQQKLFKKKHQPNTDFWSVLTVNMKREAN